MKASLKLKKLQEYKYGDNADDMLEEVIECLDEKTNEAIYEYLTQDLTIDEMINLEHS